MEISDLPVWAEVFPGESIHSWLEATRVRLGLDDGDWWTWCALDRAEPERPAAKKSWKSLPAGLGQIAEIPVDLRIAPAWREIYCPRCVINGPTGIRHPVLTKWLDVRSICCDEHLLLLSYRSTSKFIDVSSDSELLAWYSWLREWRDDSSLAVTEHRFRRDLLLAATRNWSPTSGLIAGVGSGWLLAERGWLGSGMPSSLQQPGCPSRAGMLSQGDRMSALFSAWQAWIALREGASSALPKWPREAWYWLEARWHKRRSHECGARIAVIAKSLAPREQVSRPRNGRRG